MTEWRIAGAYFESCNCDAICPCRRIGGVSGGRSTHGTCFGALGWRIDEGQAGEVELAGLSAALVISYDDDEPGSPWSFTVHVDERGDDAQRRAIAGILTGELGGDDVLRLPWIRKPSKLLSVTASPIELEHGADGYALRVGRAVSLSATRPVAGDEEVRCGIPGYDQPGIELYADSFVVDDAAFSWQLTGNCAFASAFAYSS